MSMWADVIWAEGIWADGIWAQGAGAPAVAAGRARGGWSYHPLFRKRDEDEDEDEKQQQVGGESPTASVSTPRPLEAKPQKARTLTVPSRPDFSSVKDAAYMAYIKEFSSLAAKEWMTKRRRAAEMLLLLS